MLLRIFRHNVLFSEMGGGAGLFFLRNNSILDTHITIGGYRETQSDIIQWIEVTMTTYQEKNYVNEPIYNDPFFAQYFQYYSLSNLLSVYGPPENISIGIKLAAQMRGLDQYYLFLDYSTSGWIALITMAAHTERRRYYLGCPNDGFTSLRLWSPGDTEMARKYGINKESGYPWPLEKATSLTLDDFYEQFKVPTKQCLETNIDQLTFPK